MLGFKPKLNKDKKELNNKIQMKFIELGSKQTCENNCKCDKCS